MAPPKKKEKAPRTPSVAAEKPPSPPPPVVEESEEIEEDLPPPEEPPKPFWTEDMYLPELIHPACVGWERSDNGTMRWQSNNITPVLAGMPWAPSHLVVSAPGAVSSRPATSGIADGTVGSEEDGPATSADAPPVAAMVSDRGRADSEQESKESSVTTGPSMPLEVNSNEGVFLDEKVWPTLEPALEKLLQSLHYHIPISVRAEYEDPSMRRTLHPEDVADFDPVNWLALYLKRYNPMKPSRYTQESAAIKMQATYRGFQGRQQSRAARKKRDAEVAAEAQARTEEAAATKIRAAFKGHSVRMAISQGQHPAPHAQHS